MSIITRIKNVLAGQKTGPENDSPPAPVQNPDAFYIDTIEATRAEKDRFFRTNAYSPIQDRAGFTGLSYYPPDPAMRFELPLQPAAQHEELMFQTSTGDERLYYRLGTVQFNIEGEPAQLAVYKSPDHDDLFMPFRDATSGNQTYGAGRYLEPVDLGGGKLLVDFNLAYNPFCAYSEHYSCPLPPLENWLKVPVRAGEKNYPAESH